jgi:hypothetical protein
MVIGFILLRYQCSAEGEKIDLIIIIVNLIIVKEKMKPIHILHQNKMQEYLY